MVLTRESSPAIEPTRLRPHHAPDRPSPFSAVVFSYLAVRRVLSLVVLLLRRSGSTEIEILVLRHELEILCRRQPLPCLQPADRVWLATLSRLLARERWSAFGVRPETLLRWRRRLVARHWTYPYRHPGRPPTAEELAALIVRMATDNSTWSYQRIQGELLHLGHPVAASTIAKVLKTHGIKPAPRRTSATWRQFLHQQAAGIVACDFFSVDTISLRQLYVLFFIHHGSRRVFLAGITTNPTTDWVTQCARNVTAEVQGRRASLSFLKERLLSRGRSSKRSTISLSSEASRTDRARAPAPRRDQSRRSRRRGALTPSTRAGAHWGRSRCVQCVVITSLFGNGDTGV